MAIAAAGRLWSTCEGPLTEAAKNVAGKVVADQVEVAFKGFRSRFLSMLPLPENRELILGLRTAYLVALQKTLKNYKSDLDRLSPAERDEGDDKAFFLVVQEWLDKIGPVGGKGVADLEVTARDVASLLDHVVNSSAVGGVATPAAAARTDAESRILAEICSIWKEKAPPPRFMRWFKGGGEQAGWYDMFARYVSQQIKTNVQFSAIFLATELGGIKSLLSEVLVETKAGDDRLYREIGETNEKVDDSFRELKQFRSEFADFSALVLAKLEAQGKTAAAKEEGIAPETLLKLAGRSNLGKELDLEQATKDFEFRLKNAVDAIQEGKRGNRDTPSVNTALRRISEKIKEGDVEGAARDVDAELAARAERREPRDGDHVALLRAAVRVDFLQRDPEAVASRIVEISAVEFPSDLKAQLRAIEDEWKHYYELGWKGGVNLPLEVAIAIARHASSLCAEKPVRGSWLVSLGRALQLLGERERGTERLEEAVKVYLMASGTLPSGSRSWAMVQNNLGVVLGRLAGWESGTKRLEESAAAFRAALETGAQRDRDRAQTQNNLGATLAAHYLRDRRIELLLEAEDLYRTALTVYTRETGDVEWASTMCNLGVALSLQGRGENGTNQLTKALLCFESGLEVYTQEDWPLEWGNAQYNMGDVLAQLGERENAPERFRVAERAYRSALLTRSQKLAPLYWADTQFNLGTVLEWLGMREAGTKKLEEAEKCCFLARGEYVRVPSRPELRLVERALERIRRELIRRRLS